MSTHKHIDKICLAAALLSLVLCIVWMGAGALGVQSVSRAAGYETLLFDATRIHTIDIVMDDWDGFLDTAAQEEYTLCSLVIDGEAVRNVGIRGKGNTSLTTVASMNSQRYSFKVEFDHYDSTQNYYGLDKLCLNNLIQDNTCMKDYLTYQMMAQFGVDAPLCSYVWITVNGEDWGLYLAVEGVEEAFLQRNYGSGYGQLYKPDSMSMGGGRGNGMDFDLSDLPDISGFSDFSDFSDSSALPELPDFSAGPSGQGGQQPGEGGISMGSSDVKLQYIDDDPDSYSNIFSNAKTDVTDRDKARLIARLKQLSAYEDLDEVLDVDEVLRYFVVHNYVVNGDSYTGSMIHNYYLYEEDGQLSMIPWDYNLAFGTFQSGSASAAVNDDIDAVLSDRPMQAWIFSDETYTQRYHELFAQLLEQVDIQGIIDGAYTLIAPYVEQDPTAFCTYEEFLTGTAALKEFCALRSESVRLQLAGSDETVDPGDLSLSDMGTMNNGGGFENAGNFGGMDFGRGGPSGGNDAAPDGTEASGGFAPGGAGFGGAAGMPQETDADGASGKTTPPDGMELPDGADLPDGAEPFQDGGTPGEMTAPDGAAGPSEITAPGGTAGSGGMTPPGELSPTGENGPGGMGFPSANGTDGGISAPDFSGGGSPGGTGFGGAAGTVILLAVSLLALAAGLLFAFKFRR